MDERVVAVASALAGWFGESNSMDWDDAARAALAAVDALETSPRAETTQTLAFAVSAVNWCVGVLDQQGVKLPDDVWRAANIFKDRAAAKHPPTEAEGCLTEDAIRGAKKSYRAEVVESSLLTKGDKT